MQVTGKERKVANENLFRDVAKIVSEKCINPETHRAYTVTMIEKMMRDCHVNLQPKKSAKQQALEVIRQLRAVESFKIAPAMMEILISLDPKLVDTVSPHILKLVHYIIRQEKNAEGIFELVSCFFRVICIPFRRLLSNQTTITPSPVLSRSTPKIDSASRLSGQLVTPGEAVFMPLLKRSLLRPVLLQNPYQRLVHARVVRLKPSQTVP